MGEDAPQAPMDPLVSVFAPFFHDGCRILVMEKWYPLYSAGF